MQRYTFLWLNILFVWNVQAQCTLKGQVQDQEQQTALAKAEVKLWKGEELIEKAKTNSEGAYQFVLSESDTLDLMVVHKGYSQVEWLRIPCIQQQTIELDISLIANLNQQDKGADVTFVQYYSQLEQAQTPTSSSQAALYASPIRIIEEVYGINRIEIKVERPEPQPHTNQGTDSYLERRRQQQQQLGNPNIPEWQR